MPSSKKTQKLKVTSTTEAFFTEKKTPVHDAKLDIKSKHHARKQSNKCAKKTVQQQKDDRDEKKRVADAKKKERLLEKSKMSEQEIQEKRDAAIARQEEQEKRKLEANERSVSLRFLFTTQVLYLAMRRQHHVSFPVLELMMFYAFGDFLPFLKKETKKLQQSFLDRGYITLKMSIPSHLNVVNQSSAGTACVKSITEKKHQVFNFKMLPPDESMLKNQKPTSVWTCSCVRTDGQPLTVLLGWVQPYASKYAKGNLGNAYVLCVQVRTDNIGTFEKSLAANTNVTQLATIEPNEKEKCTLKVRDSSRDPDGYRWPLSSAQGSGVMPTFAKCSNKDAVAEANGIAQHVTNQNCQAGMYEQKYEDSVCSFKKAYSRCCTSLRPYWLRKMRETRLTSLVLRSWKQNFANRVCLQR